MARRRRLRYNEAMTSLHKRDPRVQTALPVQLRIGASTSAIDAEVRNLSRSGAAIEFSPTLGKPDVQFEIGDSVDLETDAASPSAEPKRGIVVRRDANGIAIKFDKPEEELLSQIVETVQRLIGSDTRAPVED